MNTENSTTQPSSTQQKTDKSINQTSTTPVVQNNPTITQPQSNTSELKTPPSSKPTAYTQTTPSLEHNLMTTEELTVDSQEYNEFMEYVQGK